MSFSFDTKKELCRLPVQRHCCARAEAYGVLLYCNTFHPSEVRIVTGNPNFAARLPRLFHRALGLTFDRQPEPEQTGKLVFQITAPEKLNRIMDQLGYDPHYTPMLHINFGLLEEPCCQTAFLRGAFFAGGSVSDPAKQYHLELITSHFHISREMEVLLRERGFAPKQSNRNGSYVTYFKQSTPIEDFLTLTGAPSAAMHVMNAKLEKDLLNSVNRRLNCDSANLDKTVDAAQEQLKAIRILQDNGLLATLPDKLQQTAALRLEYPELSLSELAAEFDPPVTKSCLNHRLRKLLSLAEEKT